MNDGRVYGVFSWVSIEKDFLHFVLMCYKTTYTLNKGLHMFKSFQGKLRKVKSLHQFVGILTDAKSDAISGYADEISSDRQFHGNLKQNQKNAGRGPYHSWYPSIGSMLGKMLYTLVRVCKPERVVETGVASGGSSSYFLCGLERNGNGELHSIDDPWGDRVGWIIPDYLRYRWNLIEGRSSSKLLPLLGDIGTIDIFMHDSDHSYRNMIWEYQSAWDNLSKGGILLSHNVDENNAFSDFCEEKETEGLIITNMGGTVKRK